METTANSVTIRKSSSGLGLFATVQIQKGGIVAEYTGALIPTKTADVLKTRYLFEIDSEWTVDGSPRTNKGRYVNHSCDPNCEADIRGSRIFIHALRDISAGEELTIDYGEEYFDEFIRPTGCKCEKCSVSKVPTRTAR